MYTLFKYFLPHSQPQPASNTFLLEKFSDLERQGWTPVSREWGHPKNFLTADTAGQETIKDIR